MEVRKSVSLSLVHACAPAVAHTLIQTDLLSSLRSLTHTLTHTHAHSLTPPVALFSAAGPEVVRPSIRLREYLDHVLEFNLIYRHRRLFCVR